MPSDPEPRTCLWYKRLLNLYPGAFCERYGAEMLQAFDEDWSRASNRGPTSKIRYGLHVLRDLAGTMLTEWLKALPRETRIALAGMGTMVFLYAAGHQYLTLADWLLLWCYLAALRAVLLRPSRLQFVASLLLTAAFSAVYFWSAKLLTGIGHSAYGNKYAVVGSWLFGAVFAFACLGSLKCAWGESCRSLLSHYHARYVFGIICCASAIAAMVHFGVKDGAHAWNLSILSMMLGRQLDSIRRNTGNDAAPDSESAPG